MRTSSSDRRARYALKRERIFGAGQVLTGFDLAGAPPSLRLRGVGDLVVDRVRDFIEPEGSATNQRNSRGIALAAEHNYAEWLARDNG